MYRPYFSSLFLTVGIDCLTTVLPVVAAATMPLWTIVTLALLTSLPEWMPECTTIPTIIFSPTVKVLLALQVVVLAEITPEWTSVCTIFLSLDVDVLATKTYLVVPSLVLGWTIIRTIIPPPDLEVLATQSSLVFPVWCQVIRASFLPIGFRTVTVY